MSRPAKRRTVHRPRREKMGPVVYWCPGNGSGYRAKCTLCPWSFGARNHGDYVWNVQERALKHIQEKHERRTTPDRRRPPVEKV